MIHSEDNGVLDIKITNEGDLYVFCPECKGIWQTNLELVHKPDVGRQINYGGTGIKLGLGSAETSVKKPSPSKASVAKKLFPEAYK